MGIVLSAGLAALVTAVVILLGRRLRSYGVVLLGALVALMAIWLTGLELIRRDWHDMDGLVDCYPACNGWHFAAFMLIFAPPLVALVLIVAVSVAVFLERRR